MFLNELIENNLPFNRKERFFTGTVFPLIFCQNNFQYLSRFIQEIDPSFKVNIKCTMKNVNIQFFTEYNLFESGIGSKKFNYEEIHKFRDTPDILFLIDDYHKKHLFALEAKMYDTPSCDSLQKQLNNQQIVLEYLKVKLNIEKLYHYALLPKKLVESYTTVKFKYITWEKILELFKDVSEYNYFIDILKFAVDNYSDLVSKYTINQFGKNSEGRRKGIEIYKKFRELKIMRVGRRGGLNGDSFSEDINSGSWQDFEYEVSTKTDLPNRNWFSIKCFIKRINETNGGDCT